MENLYQWRFSTSHIFINVLHQLAHPEERSLILPEMLAIIFVRVTPVRHMHIHLTSLNSV